MKNRIIGTNYVNGYKIIHIPDYPKSTSVGDGGWQYEHMVLMENDLGRLLTSSEHVHHLDGNRGNNRIENLVVLPIGHHARIHKWMERGNIQVAAYCRSPSCVVCGLTLQHKQLVTCSNKCNNVVRASNGKASKVKPSKDDLSELTKKLPFTKIGKLFGVSDNAVRKWCKNYDIPYKKHDIK